MKAVYTNLNDENYRMLELLSTSKGIKKNHIINEALSCYFDTLKSVPETYMVHPLVISEEEFARIEEQSRSTEALKRLMNED